MAAASSEISRLRAAARIQARVIGALILRETRTRFGESRLGYAWALGEPVVHVMILTIIFSSIRSRSVPLGTSMEMFFLTGIVPMLLFRNLVSSTMTAISSNEALLNYPLVRPMDAFLSRIILESATMAISTLIIGAIFMSQGLLVISSDPVGVLAAFGAAIFLGSGIGILGAAISIIFSTWNKIWRWIQRMLYLTSGVFFVVDFLPVAARDILFWNPAAHAIAWMRSAHYPGYESEFLDTNYILIVSGVTLAFGLLGERALRRRREE